MLARKVRLVVGCREVCNRLPNACLCNGSLNFSKLYLYISCEESLDIARLDSTNGPARAPHMCLIREVHNQMLHRQEEAGWKDLL